MVSAQTSRPIAGGVNEKMQMRRPRSEVDALLKFAILQVLKFFDHAQYKSCYSRPKHPTYPQCTEYQERIYKAPMIPTDTKHDKPEYPDNAL